MISIKAIKSYSLIIDVKLQACETHISSALTLHQERAYGA